MFSYSLCVQNYFENWSKLGSFVDKRNTLHVTDFNFWIKWGEGYVMVTSIFAYAASFKR